MKTLNEGFFEERESKFYRFIKVVERGIRTFPMFMTNDLQIHRQRYFER